ncbi:MAG: HrpF protein [Rouxiella aceris]|uniref:HrpF protein n=1 Tax=Rouxiella aceris TaxID=2703884 RepID=UPI00283F6332|nr:HrpF protein [Rouxiella aceris]MDR3431860.1 HrpF protein [Rouxiella aceris]
MRLLDPTQARLFNQVNRTYNNLYQTAKKSSNKPYSMSDMYAFHNMLMDVSNANWANAQYTQFKHGLKKTIIESSNG